MRGFPGMIALFWCAGAAGQGFNCDTPATPLLPNPAVLGNGAAGSVSRAQLQAALDAGGDIRLNVGTSTITLDATLLITRAVRLDGNGATLSGASARRVIEIRNPTLATYDILLKNLILRDGDARTAVGNEFARSGGAILNDHGSEPWRAVFVKVEAYRLGKDGERTGSSSYFAGANGKEVLGAGSPRGNRTKAPEAMTVSREFGAGGAEGDKMVIRVTAAGESEMVQTEYIYEWKRI